MNQCNIKNGLSIKKTKRLVLKLTIYFEKIVSATNIIEKTNIVDRKKENFSTITKH